MTEDARTTFRQPDASQRSAGELIRAERERQGLSIEALSSIIKVVPGKIEALERGDLASLGDANFTRALAQTICRSLRIDPASVMGALPPAQPARLHDEHAPLNQPLPAPGTASLFSVRGVGSGVTDLLRRKWFVPLLILLAAAVVWLWPQGWGGALLGESQPTSVQVAVPVMPPAMPADEASGPAEAALPVDGAASAEADAPAAEAPASKVSAAEASAPAQVTEPLLTPVSGGIITMSATQPSWVELTESRTGRKLFSRLVQAGEVVELNGEPPIDAVIGNAGGVQIRLRGQAVDLAPHVRNNVARVSLR